MEDLSGQSHVIYDLLKGGLADEMERRLAEQQEGVVKAVRKLLDETT